MFTVLPVNHVLPLGEDLRVKDVIPQFGFGPYDDVGINIVSYSLKFWCFSLNTIAIYHKCTPVGLLLGDAVVPVGFSGLGSSGCTRATMCLWLEYSCRWGNRGDCAIVINITKDAIIVMEFYGICMEYWRTVINSLTFTTQPNYVVFADVVVQLGPWCWQGPTSDQVTGRSQTPHGETEWSVPAQYQCQLGKDWGIAVLNYVGMDPCRRMTVVVCSVILRRAALI